MSERELLGIVLLFAAVVVGWLQARKWEHKAKYWRVMCDEENARLRQVVQERDRLKEELSHFEGVEVEKGPIHKIATVYSCPRCHEEARFTRGSRTPPKYMTCPKCKSRTRSDTWPTRDAIARMRVATS